jgi:hypothetical protein
MRHCTAYFQHVYAATCIQLRTFDIATPFADRIPVMRFRQSKQVTVLEAG